MDCVESEQLPVGMVPSISPNRHAFDQAPHADGQSMISTNPSLAQATAPQRQVFRREGEYWTISYDGVICRLKDSKGLQLLAHLLCNPGQRVSALQLLSVAQALPRETMAAVTAPAEMRAVAGPDGSAAERARVNVTRAIKGALHRIGAHHPTLRAHLSTTVRTGNACVYQPDPRVPVRWEILLVNTPFAINGWDEV